MQLRDFLTRKVISEGGNLASHTAAGTPTVGWKGIPGNYSAGKIDSKNRAVMQPAVKQLLVDINNLFTRQYGRPIWSAELIEKEVQTFISGSSKWFMQLRQPNPNFNPQQPVSDANPKEIGVTDKDFQRVKKKVGDIDTQIDRRLEPQIEEFIHKNIGVDIGSATLLGTKKGSDQWLALWQIHEPPITLQVDLEFSDYTTDERGFEIPTEWAQISHGSAWEDLEAGMKGVFRQWLYRSLAKIAPTDKYIARMAGAGKNKGIKLFGGDDGKEPVVDLDNPPPPFHDANFSFAVASVGGGGVRAKYRQPTPAENVPLEINGVPVMVPLSSAESDYIKDMGQQFEQFFGEPGDGTQTKMMASFVGSVELMKQYFTPEQQQIAVNEFLKINFGKGAQMIDADDPTSDFKTKMVAIDYLLDKTGMTNMRKQVLQMAKDYENAFNAKKATEPLAEAEEQPAVKAQFRKGMPHLRDLKPVDFLDLLDEIHDGNGRFKLQNIPLNVKVDGFGGRFGKSADGRPFMATSNTPPRFEAGFVKHHQQKGTTDPEILGRAQLFDNLFGEMMNAVAMVDKKLGPDFLVNKQVTCEVLYLPFASETEDGKLKFVGIAYDKLPKGVQLALVPFRVVDASTGEDLPNANKIVTELTRIGKQGSVMFIDNSLKQKDGLDVTEIINPLENLEELKKIVSDTAGKRDRASLQLRKEVEEKLMPVKLAFEKAVSEDPNILGKDILGQDYEGIVINSRLGPIKITSQTQKDVITQKNAARAAVRASQAQQGNIPQTGNKTAVVAIGSFVGHRGHEELLDYTIKKASQVSGDPYLFIGNAEGKDDPIPPAVKVQTWHKMYPQLAKNISTVQAGGSLMQKIKHELIQPQPGKAPRYDNIIIMVGEDQAKMNIANALMKSVNKFPGYENVKVSLEVTPRGTGMSFTKLRNILKDPNATPEQQYAVWAQGFDEQKLGKDWILHLMDLTRKGMGIQLAPQPVAERLFNALVRPRKAEPLAELFQPGKDWKWSFKGSEEAVAVFHVGEIPYQFYAYRPDENYPGWDVEFKNAQRGKDRITKFGLTGTGNSAEVMSTVADIMRAFLQEYQGKIKELTFSANESSRQALYARMAKRLLPTWNLTQDGREFKLSAPTEQGVAEGFDKEADAYKEKLLSTLPQMMRFYEKNVEGWKPSKEQMLGAIDTGYMVMKHTGDVKQAGKAMMDELNTLHRMSQGQQGVAEGLAGNDDIARLKAGDKTSDGINMQDIRLMAGEGKLTKQTVLQALAVIRKQRSERGVTEARVEINQDAPDNLYDIQDKLAMSRWKSSVKNVITSLFAKQYPGVQLFFKNTQDGNLFVTTDKTALASEDVGLYSDTDEFGASIIGPTAEYGVDDILYVGIGFDSIKSGKYKGIVGEMLNTIVPPMAAKLKAKPAIVIVVEDQSGGAWEAMANKLGWAFISGEDEQGMTEQGYGNHPSQRVDPRTGKKYVPPKSPLGQGVEEGAPIVVMPRSDRFGTKKPAQPYRNQGDIVPPTKPPSTEKRGVKGRPGQRPMPDHSVEEEMLPKSAFAGTKVGQKVGSVGQWKNTGPSKNRPARAGDLVGGSAQESAGKKKGADGKACWKGYRYNGTENGKDKCVPVSEDVENIMGALINKILINEAISNNKL